MKNKIVYFLFFIVVVIASFLRLFQLGNVPISPDWDEVALGYNAYSIMATGKDEYGKYIPIVLRSFDDYKPALYTYLIMPFIKMFGLTTFAVRLPSAIFGIITVISVYFLVSELFKKSSIALLTSFLLAISPWHIQFSRIAFESNVGLALNVLVALFFLKGLKNPFYLLLSAFLAGANLYVYQSEKVFTPLLITALIFIFKKEILLLPKKYIIFSVLIGLVVISPMAKYMITTKEALTRAQGVSIFSNEAEFLKNNVQRVLEDTKNHDFIGLALDNRRLFYFKSFAEGYLSHFNLNWLFISGDLGRHHAPGMGLLYLWELPFFLIGIYALIFGNFSKKIKLLLFCWFAIAPIPASITSGVPHAVRTLNFLPTFQIFIAVGLLTFFNSVVSRRMRYLALIVFVLFFIFNFSYYLDQYFVQQNYFNSREWQYGYKDVVYKIKEIQGKYKKIIVSNQPFMDQSYMFFLFYLKYSPIEYQSESQFASGGFKENHRFGKFEFRPIDWNTDSKTKSNTLFVGREDDFPQNDSGHVKTVYFLDGSPGIKLVEILR